VHPNPYSTVLKPMDRAQRLEIDDVVDWQVPVNDDEYHEAVGGQPEGGSDAGSDDGMPPEQGVDPTGPDPGDAAGADAHDGQATGDGQVAGPSGLQGAPSRTRWKLVPRVASRIRFLEMCLLRKLCR